MKEEIRYTVRELKPFMSKDALCREGMDEGTLLYLMYGDEFDKVGCFTIGGQRRFITAKLLDWLAMDTKRRL